jgi:hypothetical protein
MAGFINDVCVANRLDIPNTDVTGAIGEIRLGGNRFVSNFGTGNVFLGKDSGNTILTVATAIYNVGIGFESLKVLTGGSRNCGLGYKALAATNTGGYNTGLGYGALYQITTSQQNTALGANSGLNLLTGQYNILIGVNAGSAYTTNESSNICIGSSGVVLGNNTIHIGTQGAGNSQQNKTYIAGIQGVTPTNGPAQTVVIGTDGQLGSAAATPSMVWTTETVNGNIAVNHGYTANKAGRLDLTLPATAAEGDVIAFANLNTAVGLRIVQNANQYIRIGSAVSATGIAGYIETTAIGDSIVLRCIVAGASTAWFAIGGPQGNWTVA